MRVQITKLPLDKAAFGKQVQGSLDIQPGTMGGADYTASDKTYYKGVKDTISAVPRDKANLEAEGGETAFGPISGQSIPDHMKIVGKRHHEGGVPLNLPDDTFIFSDTAELKIKEPLVLAMFNKAPKKGGYTPAELAKPYNINKYKTILLDPDTSKLERDTATIMIKNYIMKLGALALVQESMKGFPQGIPTMAKPYMEANGISEEDLMPELKQQADALAQQMPGNNPQMPQEQNPMAAEEMQQMAPEQVMEADQAMMNQGQAQYPQQMPSGAPVASPQTMDQMPPAGAMPPPEMMQQPGMMAYGGMPYAMDGIIMGGTNMPFIMQYGGDLETFEGPDNSQVTVNSTSSSAPISDSSKLGKAYSTGTYTPGQKQTGQTYYDVENQPKIKGRGWEEGTDVEWSYSGNNGGGSWNPTRQQAIDQYCKNMQNPKSKLFYGVAAEQIAANNFGYLKNSSDPAKQAEYAAILEKLKSCKAGGKQEKYEFVTEDTPPGEDCPECDPPQLDANGQKMFQQRDPVTGECTPCKNTPPGKKICKCEDPVTGEVKEFPIEQEEECICEGGERGEVGGGGGMIMDQPHYSVNAQANILRNQMMATEPAPGNVVLPPSVQTKGAYEEYQTKTDQALAATNQAVGAVMSGTSGSTGRKQARLKDIVGKGLRAAMDAVAGVQSRNVDRQRETNVQDATITNTNNLARADVLNTGLQGQEGRGNTRIINRNKKLYNTVGSVIDANEDMALRQKMNATTPQYAAEYDYGMVYPTGVEKPLTGATGATLDDLTRKHVEKGVPYKDAYTLALREMKSKYGGQRMKNGGYVWVDNIYPFE